MVKQNREANRLGPRVQCTDLSVCPRHTSIGTPAYCCSNSGGLYALGYVVFSKINIRDWRVNTPVVPDDSGVKCEILTECHAVDYYSHSGA